MFGLWETADATEDAAGVMQASEYGGVVDIYVLAKHDPELLILHVALIVVLAFLLGALPPFKGLAFKIKCYTAGVIHFWASRENVVGNTDRTHRPSPHKEADMVEKEFIFIRHGESEWNEIFNRNKIWLLPRLFIGLCKELLCLPLKDRSIFLDSPLGDTGRRQTQTLAHEISNNPGLQILKEQTCGKDNTPRSVVMTSNLRRCVQTALLGLSPRLSESKEKVLVYSCLQEVARNVDTLALTPAGAKPVVDKCPHGELLDGTFNFGSKRWYERAIKRLNIFLKFAFAREEPRVIVVGHSLYFKKFFQTFLEVPHDAKQKKLSNCGVVSFKVQCSTSSLVTYRIVPGSIKVLHGDWI